MNGKAAAVDEYVDGSPVSWLVKGDLPELRLAPRDRRVVGDVVVQTQKLEQRAQEALGLSGGQAEDNAERDGRLDRIVRVLGLATWPPSLRPRRVPVGELAVREAEPDGQASTITEARLVLPPVPNLDRSSGRTSAGSA